MKWSFKRLTHRILHVERATHVQEETMRDNRRRYRAIRQALAQCSPTSFQGNFARHLNTRSCTSTLRIIHMGPLALASMPSSHPLPRMPGLRRSAGRYRFMQPCRPHQATSVTTHSICLFACLIVAAPVVDDPSCNALQPCTAPGTPQMSLAGTGSLHDRQEDALARNERGIYIRSVEIHDQRLAW